jgi:hypothetical protein
MHDDDGATTGSAGCGTHGFTPYLPAAGTREGGDACRTTTPPRTPPDPGTHAIPGRARPVVLATSPGWDWRWCWSR